MLALCFPLPDDVGNPGRRHEAERYEDEEHHVERVEPGVEAALEDGACPFQPRDIFTSASVSQNRAMSTASEL